ncbi:MAG: SDR family oxidoreductase [Burkholderiales bacterium]|nr:SDR family oxidoreductase [Burkholderiales bacterium]
MGRMAGKVAFLTGAGAGIAKATALAFAREGAKVGLAEIKPELGRAAEKAVREAGGEAYFVETDVTQDGAVKRAIDSVAARFGKLDVLVNCAGGSLQEDVPVHKMDLDIWERTVALNLRHPFLCCRHGIPHLLAAGGGSIINFGSWLGQLGCEKPAYAACKGGIVAFTRTIAAQYMANGIRANAIAPGTIRTERSLARWENKDMLLADSPSPDVRARLAVRKTYPFSVGESEDIAAIAVFLASDESRMITGCVVPADGGRSACFKLMVPEQ